MDFVRKVLHITVIKVIIGNPALALLLIGSALFLLGINEIKIRDINIAPYLIDLGRTIVIAGVFSAILKSAQFTALFQENILAAMYHPSHIKDLDLLLKSWHSISDAIFLHCLPQYFPMPTSLIKKGYMDSKADYHFTEFEIRYDIVIGMDGNGTVTNTLKADLDISPNRAHPVFIQTIECDGAIRLLRLLIADKRFHDYDFSHCPGNPRARQLKLKLLEHINAKTGRVRFERIFESQQNMHSEPFISATISRLINGAFVRTRVSDGYHVRFINNGIEMPNHDPIVDSDGYLRWILAHPGQLLLPGQGYTLVIVKTP